MKGSNSSNNSIRRSWSCIRIVLPVFMFIIAAVFLVITFDLLNDSRGRYDYKEANKHVAVVNSKDITDSTDTATAKGKDLDGRDEIIPSKRLKVAYAVTITKDSSFIDGALVLGYAARKYHSASKGFPSLYDVDLVAFAAPPVVTSIPILEKYGWRVLKRPLPVQLDEIENKDYVERMRNSGCCGADEFLKLWAYTLTEYHRVIHLDMDSIVFKNMDELYRIDKELLFTGDYNMKGGSKVVPVQGGFLVVKPSLDTFEEFRSIIRKGNHYAGSGWEGSHIGNFWGGQTIQGIMPFFYSVKHPDRAHELNRCVYNCMVDNPYWPNTVRCQDGKPTCQDCRLQQPEMVSSAHFTICQKPWTCTKHTNLRNKDLCEVLHAKWFQLRHEYEVELGIDISYRAIDSEYTASQGMCKGFRDSDYIQIPLLPS